MKEMLVMALVIFKRHKVLILCVISNLKQYYRHVMNLSFK